MFFFPCFWTTISGERKPIHKQTSADSISLSEDIFVEVLLRLPLNSLFRFKSVSKQWLAVISSPHFLRTNPNLGSISGLLLTEKLNFYYFHSIHDGDNSRVSSPNFLKDPYIQIFHSCNGLLCYSRKSISAREDAATSYYICNLTNRKPRKLSIPINRFCGCPVAICIAFDPSKSVHYKVVNVFNLKGKLGFYKILLYSSETRCWRALQSPFQAPSGTGFKHGVYCNGAIHWCSKTQRSIYFDVESECIKTMPMPLLSNPLHTISKFQYFGESRGSLYLVQKCQYPADAVINIMELEKDYSKWVVKYFINLYATKSYEGMIFTCLEDFWKPYIGITLLKYGLQVLCLIKGEKEEELKVLLSTRRGVISYDHKRGTMKRIFYMDSVLHDVESSGREGPIVHQYIETLSCV